MVIVKIMIYGIAADGVSDMSNWIKVLSEGIDSMDNLKFGDNTNNLNSNNYGGLYMVTSLDTIKITWHSSNVPVNIEIVHINQNIQRFMGGMTGDGFRN